METKRNIVPILLLLALLLDIGYVGYALLQGSTLVPSRGRVKAIGVEVFWDAACTSPVSQIDWGELEPGQSKDTPVYIKNTGNAAMTLSMYTSDYLPSEAGAYIGVTWSYVDGTVIGKNQVLPVTMTIHVDAGIAGIDVFNFVITVEGTG